MPSMTSSPCFISCTSFSAGHKDALEEVQRLATAKGALKAVQVAVSGAFHTSLMQPAREALTEVLASVTINDPRIPIYSNVTGEWGWVAARRGHTAGGRVEQLSSWWVAWRGDSRDRAPTFMLLPSQFCSSVAAAEPFKSAADIKATLPRQLVEPVQWEGTMRGMVGVGKNQLFELGPGQQIKAMVKRIDTKAWGSFKNVAA